MKISIKKHVYALLLLTYIILVANSCSKKPTDYRSFLDGKEVVYPGVVSNIQANPGNQRLLLKWTPNSDPSVSKYVIYWNDNADSIIVNAKSTKPSDTIEAYINDLSENIYAFVIYSFDSKGNRSIPTNIENVEVYGTKYQNGLINRGMTGEEYSNNQLTISWSTPDTINVNTEVKYTNESDQTKTIYLSPDSSTLRILDWKLATKIYYRSAYIPERNAIDTFNVSYYDSLIISTLPVDKSTWKRVLLINDAVVNAFGTSLENIWNGQPGAYPDISHSDGAYMPLTFTIDLGETYKQLTKFEEWGRTDDASHNPVDFEVWGIADTTGAIPVLLPTDPGWKDESIAKGWTLLTEVKRNDDGIAGIQADIISNPPPVRFIRIRVLHAVDGDTYSTISEISFWYHL